MLSPVAPSGALPALPRLSPRLYTPVGDRGSRFSEANPHARKVQFEADSTLQKPTMRTQSGRDVPPDAYDDAGGAANGPSPGPAA